MSAPPPKPYADMHFCPICQNLVHVSNRPPYPPGAPGMVPAVEEGDPDDEHDKAERKARLYGRNGEFRNKDGDPAFRWYCKTCSYQYPIEEPVILEVPPQPKKVDLIMGGQDAWKYAIVSHETTCPECEKKGAYFREMQTRSADEPMTLFFRCKHCGTQWSQN